MGCHKKSEKIVRRETMNNSLTTGVIYFDGFFNVL